MLVNPSLGLWRIQFGSLAKYVDGIRTPEQVRQAISADVHAAADLISTGVSEFAVVAEGVPRR
jgi:hypothetical protein